MTQQRGLSLLECLLALALGLGVLGLTLSHHLAMGQGSRLAAA